MDNRAEIRDFLASRRARIIPEQAGLPAYGEGNRRVKGLRREEVALLAGVSIDYYVRMERGNLAGASDQVLHGVADALQLDDAEREHLLALARAAGPGVSRKPRQAPAKVRPVVQQVLDAITEAPAWVRNARHDILAMNGLARALYAPVLHSAAAGATGKRPANTARFLYLDPAAREFFIDFDHMGGDAAAMLRLEAGRNPYDKELITLVGELSTQSELFRRQWASQNVKFHRSGRKRLRHPAVGALDLNFEAMELPSEPGLRLNISPPTPTPRPQTGSSSSPRGRQPVPPRQRTTSARGAELRAEVLPTWWRRDRRVVTEFRYVRRSSCPPDRRCVYCSVDVRDRAEHQDRTPSPVRRGGAVVPRTISCGFSAMFILYETRLQGCFRRGLNLALDAVELRRAAAMATS